MPHDLMHFRYDRGVNGTVINGILYRGDAKTKYSKINRPENEEWYNVNPEEVSVICRMGNEAESS